MKKESRAMARRHIFNIVFKYPYFGESSVESEIDDYYEMLEYDRKYEAEHGDELSELEIDKDFILSEVSGVVNNVSEIDEIIEKYAVGWSIDRLASADLTILRIAVYEILFDETIPPGVSANEAVELAKEYSGEKSPSFVNGILSNVIKNEKERV